jgi:hypothetical protein
MLILASICTAYAFTPWKWWKTEPLYGHVDYQPRTGLWNYLAYFIIGGKKNEFLLLCHRNYHHYSNFGIIKHKAGKKIVVITDDTITKDVR